MKISCFAIAAILSIYSAFAGVADSLQQLIDNATGSKKTELEYELAQTLSSHDIDGAIHMAEEAISSAIRSQTHTIQLDALQLKADLLLERQAYTESQKILESAIKHAQKYKLLEGESNAVNGLGKIALRTNKLETALVQFSEALDIRKTLDNKVLVSTSLNNIGIVYREMGNLDSARYFFKASYQIAHTANILPLQADALNNMAGVYWKEGDFNRAIETYEQSLEVRKKTEDLTQIAKSLNNIGIVYKDLSNFSSSLKYHQQALKLRKEIGDQEAIAYSLNNIGSVFLKLHRPDSAISYYVRALGIRTKSSKSSQIAQSHSNTALAYKSANNFDSALYHYTKAIRFIEEIDDQIQLSNTLNLIGNLYLEQLAFDRALDYYYQSLNIREKAGRKDLEAQSLNNIGLLFKSLENYPKALDIFTKSLAIYSELNNQILIAYQHNIIGGTYWKMNELGKALHHYGIALDLRKEIGDKRHIANSLKNIGIIHKEAGNAEKAKDSYQKAIDIYSSINDSVGKAWSLAYLGNVYKDLKEYGNAYMTYISSQKLFRSTKNSQGLAAIAFNLAELLLEQGQWQAAMNWLKKAAVRAEETGDKTLLMKSSQLLSEHYSRAGSYASAYKYQEIHARVKDSIANTEVMKRFADIQIKHEIALKNAEMAQIQKENTISELANQRSNTILLSIMGILFIAFVSSIVFYKQKSANAQKLEQMNIELQKANRELQQSEANLAHANITKTKFFSIIAHDLRNPFSSFIGLTGMLIEHYPMLSDEKKLSFLSNLNVSANKTFLLLENLLDWSRSEISQIRTTPESIDLNEVIQDIFDLQKSFASQKHIFLTSNIPNGYSVRADKNMLTSVLRNLISNALKFTDENGTVEVSTQDTGGSIEIAIQDSGCGLNDSDINKLFDRNADFKQIGNKKHAKGAGLGLILCKEFIEKNNGSIHVESAVGKGSRFSIVLPKSK